MAMKVKVTDNSAMFLDAKDDAIKRAMEEIGIVAEGYAKGLCPVDTSRLRGSITYATSTKHSDGEKPAEPADYEMRGAAEDGMVAIGTNVEYALYVERGTHKQSAKPYLAPAIKNHASQYKKIIEMELKSS